MSFEGLNSLLLGYVTSVLAFWHQLVVLFVRVGTLVVQDVRLGCDAAS